MRIYHLNSKNELIGVSKARKSPLEKDVYLIPQNATDTPPPPKEKGKKRIFNRETNSWKQEKMTKVERIERKLKKKGMKLNISHLVNVLIRKKIITQEDMEV